MTVRRPPTLPSPILWGRVREGGRDRRAEPRGGVTPRLGVPKGVCPLRGDSTRGLGPLVRVGEAGSRAEPAREGGILEQEVDRLSGGPPAWTPVRPRPGASPPRLRGRAPFA